MKLLKYPHILAAAGALLIGGCASEPQYNTTTYPNYTDPASGDDSKDIVGPGDQLETSRGTNQVGRWSYFREYTFEYNDSTVPQSFRDTTLGIVKHMKANPAVQVGVDGSMDPRGTDPKDALLTERREEAVRRALIEAGAPAHRVRIGTFGATENRRDRRVAVYLSIKH